MWGALGKVGCLLGESSLGPSSPHCCLPSEIASTEEGGRCGPGVTHIWKPGPPLPPAPQMTEAHPGTGGVAWEHIGPGGRPSKEAGLPPL